MMHPRPVPSLALVLASALAFPGLARAAEAPPKELETLESRAEDAYDAALAGHAQDLSREASAAGRAWKAYRPRALEAGASQALVEAVDGSVRNLEAAAARPKERIAAARAANGVSAHMAALFALYRTRVPPAVLRLDYLGREIALDARTQDLDAARSSLGAIEETWQALRPKVLATGHGEEAARRYQADVDAVRTALLAEHAEKVREAAERSLDDVDRLEAVFAR